jgi:hypothetical protein
LKALNFLVLINPEVELEKFKKDFPVEVTMMDDGFILGQNKKFHLHDFSLHTSTRLSLSVLLTTTTTMKFSCLLLLLLSVSVAKNGAAFSAVAPNKAAPVAPAANSAAVDAPPVDRSMKGIDDDVANAFDPTTGENPALTRNNKDEVWVPQVRNIRNIL